MLSNNVNDFYTIQDLIELGKENSLNLENTNILAKNNHCDITYPIHNILRDSYRPIILRYCKEITLDDEALEFYKYNPKKMSFNLYGGVELWHLLLWINNMTSITQFNRKKLLIFHPQQIPLLSTILDLEEVNLYDNRKSPYENME